MAEEVLKKLEEQLCCSICLDTYTDPKLLQCFHIYCQQCLVPLVVRDQQGRLCITCPSCRQVTPVPDRGVVGLQSAFQIQSLLEIKDSFHRSQTPERATASVAKSCLEHVGEELRLYCETCEQLVCSLCVSSRGGHAGHYFDDVNRAFEKYKAEAASSMELLEEQVTTFKEALVVLNEHCRNLSAGRVVSEGNIRVTFRKLRDVLAARESELVGQLDRKTQTKLKDLAVQRDQIETKLARLESVLRFFGESLKTRSEADVLEMKGHTVNAARELTTQTTPFEADLKPRDDADLAFTAPAGMTEMCQNYGLLSVPRDPMEFPSITRNVEQSFTPAVEPRVESIESLRHEVSYVASARLDARLIDESAVAMTSPAVKLVAPILSIDGVLGPSGVAINKARGEVVVAEWEGRRVSVFSLTGEKLRSFHGGGSEGHVQYRGVAVDGRGNILLPDYWNGHIHRFSAEGKLLTEVGSKGCGPWQFSYPTSIALGASDDKVYVVDRTNHRVQILISYDLSFFDTFGKEGDGKAEFSYPSGIAVGKTGEVYVADSGNHRVQVFTAGGKFLRMFGCYEGMEDLNYPNCISVDAEGMVYVGEGGSYRVSVFTPEGHPVMSFGRKGEGPGEFNWPCGLSHDHRDVLYLCDYSNNRLQVFS
jgi:DNA-binding beta-propeller fold protein YncE/uncharacterized protein YjiS (DUF1127 family)